MHLSESPFNNHRYISISLCSVLLWIAVGVGLCGCRSVSTRGADNNALLARHLDSILHRQDKTKAVYIARVLELPSRREIYGHDIDEPFIPASNLKLFTTSTGLDRLGPEHGFKTYLLRDGDGLW